MSDVKVCSDIDRRRQDALERLAVDRADMMDGGRPSYIFTPTEGDIHLTIKRAVAQDLKECRWSREEVADGLSRLLGRRITVAQIDAMTAATKIHRFPAEWVPAWVRVTGSRRILEILCAECGLWLADAIEHDLADLARTQLRAEQSKRKMQELKTKLREFI